MRLDCITSANITDFYEPDGRLTDIRTLPDRLPAALDTHFSNPCRGTLGTWDCQKRLVSRGATERNASPRAGVRVLEAG